MFVQIEDRSAKFKIIYNDQNLCKTHVRIKLMTQMKINQYSSCFR